jgi:acetyl esterase/lipase
VLRGLRLFFCRGGGTSSGISGTSPASGSRSARLPSAAGRYALTLSRAGVPAELHLHPGVPHEYDAIAFDADVSRRAQSDRDRVLRSL